MTGRFSHLELTTQSAPFHEQNAQAPAGEAIRGAAYHYANAEKAARNGAFDDALKHYTKALGVDRKYITAWVGQVCMLIELGECIEAATWSEKALEVFKTNGELLATRATALARLSRSQDASAVCDEAMTAPGSSPLRWRSRAEVLFSGNKTRAADCLRQSVSVTNADWYDCVLAARCARFHNAAVVGHEHALRATQLNPGAAFAWFTRGTIEESIGLSAAAINSYVQAAHLAPTVTLYSQSISRMKSRGIITRLRDFTKGLIRK